MNETPIRTMKTYEAVIQRLLEGIESREFPPGSKLPSVRQLSLDWQVGQAAVREALSALKAMNLVTSRQGEGTFVNVSVPEQIAKVLPFGNLMSSEEVQSLLELRLVLESGVARLAAKRRTAAELKALSDILGTMEEDLAVARLGEKVDWQFHHTLAQASKNSYLLHLMESVREKIEASQLASRLALYRIEGEPERLLRQHAEILKAVEAENEKAAEEAMIRHLRHVESEVRLLQSGRL